MHSLIISQQIISKLQWMFLYKYYKRIFFVYSPKTHTFLECRAHSLPDLSQRVLLCENNKKKKRLLQRFLLQKQDLPDNSDKNSLERFILSKIDLETLKFRNERTVFVEKYLINLVETASEIELKGFINEDKRTVNVFCDSNLKSRTWKIAKKGDLKTICKNILREIVIVSNKNQYLYLRELEFIGKDEKASYKTVCEKTQKFKVNNKQVQAISRIVNLEDQYFLLNINENQGSSSQELKILKNSTNEAEIKNCFNLLQISSLKNGDIFGIDFDLLSNI